MKTLAFTLLFSFSAVSSASTWSWDSSEPLPKAQHSEQEQIEKGINWSWL